MAAGQRRARREEQRAGQAAGDVPAVGDEARVLVHRARERLAERDEGQRANTKAAIAAAAKAAGRKA